MMASATDILSGKENHMTRFLEKSMFFMNLDKTVTINSYFKMQRETHDKAYSIAHLF